MRAPTAVAALVVLAATPILLATTGCMPDLHGLKVIYPETGGEATLMFGDEGYCSAGGTSIYLPPTYELSLKGEWIEIGAATDLQAVVVRTPEGLVTAADLAAAERPTAIATLEGTELEMICVCNKAGDGRPTVSCADSQGRRWSDHRREPRAAAGRLPGGIP